MLKEADDRTNFTDLLTSLTGRSHLDPDELRKRLLLCIYGLGTNIGLKHMAMGNPDVTAKDLAYVRQRFLSCDHLRNVNQRLVNALLAHRDPAIWGEVTSCASDSKKFSAWDQNLLTEWHTRYRGPGVIIYWHVDKKSTCIYSQLKTCSSSEVSAMITGIVRHCTDMEVKHHYVDSHGQSEVAFGLCRLLGFELRPRLKPIHQQKLYLPSEDAHSQFPQLAPVLTRAINWDLIRQHYDELVKYTTAIRQGVAEADAILRRFTRQTNHPTYRAMVELGRAIKTIYLCRYLHNLALRYEVQAGLNVIENWNSANSYVFYGRYGELRTNQRESQELSMLCLQVLQNAMVFINTLMIQEVVAATPELKHLSAREFRGLTPLMYQHINPYGVFYLDLRTRLPLALAQAA
jgi:TnpA family transposase